MTHQHTETLTDQLFMGVIAGLRNKDDQLMTCPQPSSNPDALRDELKQSYTQLISKTAHDLRTPISAILASLYLLREAGPPERRDHYWTMLNDQIDYLIAIVNTFSTTMNWDEAQHSVEAILDLNALVKGICSVLQPIVDAKSLTLHVESTDDTLLIQGDEVRLSRALVNLVQNAVRYTPQGGTVTLRTKRDSKMVCVEVVDTGIGIPETEQAHVFDSRFRGSNLVDAEHTGHGMGLTIVKQIAKDHGGHVEVDSTLGNGSVFRLHLPCVPV